MADKPLYRMSGTVRSRTKTEREKKDLETERSAITVMNAEGGKFQIIDNGNGVFESFSAEQEVVVEIRAANKTLTE